MLLLWYLFSFFFSRIFSHRYATLAEGLLAGENTRGAGRRRGEATAIPPYVRELCDALFAMSDVSGSGQLTTIDLTRLLAKRAKGTVLEGNAHAIFALRTLLASQASHGEIRGEEFATGLWKSIEADPNGAVAQWILLELMEEAERWDQYEYPAPGGAHAVLYRHPTAGDVREKPAVLVAMERCAALLGEGARRSDVTTAV